MDPQTNSKRNRGGNEETENNKVSVQDEITTGVLKAGCTCLVEEIHKLLFSAWKEENIPREWQEVIIIHIHKKGAKKDCNNYRD